MLTDKGPKVLEFNARFGDPETQVILPRLKTDLLDIIEAIIDERLDAVNIEWSDDAAVCVVLASGGYPEKYQTGLPINGLENAAKMKDIILFHAGTKVVEGKLVTAGGRVLNVVATGKTREEAAAKCYEAIKKISFPNMHYRTDIART